MMKLITILKVKINCWSQYYHYELTQKLKAHLLFLPLIDKMRRKNLK